MSWQSQKHLARRFSARHSRVCESLQLWRALRFLSHARAQDRSPRPSPARSPRARAALRAKHAYGRRRGRAMRSKRPTVCRSADCAHRRTTEAAVDGQVALSRPEALMPRECGCARVHDGAQPGKVTSVPPCVTEARGQRANASHPRRVCTGRSVWHTHHRRGERAHARDSAHGHGPEGYAPERVRACACRLAAQRLVRARCSSLAMQVTAGCYTPATRGMALHERWRCPRH